MNTLKSERGLSLSDVNKLYNYDEYRKKTINRTNTVALKEFEKQSKNQQLFNLNENLTNLNTIDVDSESKIEMSTTIKVTTTDEKAKSLKEKAVLKVKKDFSEKLRRNTQVFPPKQPTLDSKQSISETKPSILNPPKKSILEPKKRESSTESSGSYTSLSRSRSRSPPPPPKKVVQPPPPPPAVKMALPPPVSKQQPATKFIPPQPEPAMNGRSDIKSPQNYRQIPGEKTDKIKQNYKFESFQSYYDKEADVLGLACCTCCVPKCKKIENCCRGCSNLVSCPVYCWILFILPLVIAMIIAMIVLALVGAKVIT
jgi:hypothetical protein